MQVCSFQSSLIRLRKTQNFTAYEDKLTASVFKLIELTDIIMMDESHFQEFESFYSDLLGGE